MGRNAVKPINENAQSSTQKSQLQKYGTYGFLFKFDYEFGFKLESGSQFKFDYEFGFEFKFDYEFEFKFEFGFQFKFGYEFQFKFEFGFQFKFDYEFEFKFEFGFQFHQNMIKLCHNFTFQNMEVLCVIYAPLVLKLTNDMCKGSAGASSGSLCLGMFAPVLAHFDSNQPIVVSVDSSKHAVVTMRLPTVREPMNEVLIPKLAWTEFDQKNYAKKVRTALEGLPSVAGQLEVSQRMAALIGVIRGAAALGDRTTGSVVKLEPKNPWYGRSCDMLRKRVFALLNLYRKGGGLAVKELYLKSRRRYVALTQETKTKYYRDLCQRFGTAGNSKEFWRLVNSFRPSVRGACSGLSTCQLKTHFESLLNVGAAPDIEYGPVPWLECEELDAPFRLRPQRRFEKSEGKQSPRMR
ncbi:unnamed protein product [Nesidiocoris tenuis]|uniref:Uncharacterized protein n=1 Tax=Nesidiocoris tenuis TaxID=355587 RepID=A0A6H5GHQ5_9HEMI|nr:unnamed protein product [Nesidiocoris tenuis]